MTAQLVLATRNAHKLRELRRVLAEQHLDVDVLGLADVVPFHEPDETEPTFEGNALIKAHACFAVTGLPSLADDSGLEVDVFNGMPGVRSARWSGVGATDEDNLCLLLRQLQDVPEHARGARFVCAMALVGHGYADVVRGEMTGRLTNTPTGDNGFGYDPIFVPDGHDLTTAAMEPAEKDALSHRGKAVRAIVPLCRERLA